VTDSSAFATVVGAQDQRHIFQRHDDGQAPDDQRHHAQQVGFIERNAVLAGEHFLHRVQRAGADVAVDDADGGDGEGADAAVAVAGIGGGQDGPCAWLTGLAMRMPGRHDTAMHIKMA
jgi:hypothetical protein